jgi:hypothetical protein
MQEYKRRQFQEGMEKSIQQAKEGKVRTVTPEELDRWEKELDNRPLA